MTPDDLDESIRGGIVAFFTKYLDDAVLERIITERSRQSGATVHDLAAVRGARPAVPAAGGRPDSAGGGRPDSRADGGRGGGKLVSSSQLERLEKIRNTKMLWGIIDERCVDRKVDAFADLTYDEAQYALDTFYENAGSERGGRPAAGRR